MYKYRDKKQDIPNTFDSKCSNKFFSVPMLIYNLGRGWIKREDLPHDVLKRIDAEIKFLRETKVKPKVHEKNTSDYRLPSK